jgi:GAF domain-containing protein
VGLPVFIFKEERMAPLPENSQQVFEQLARLLHALEAAGQAAMPRFDRELLQSIVEAAARIFGAAAASIALIDEKTQTLVFRVATGAGNENVVGMRVPLDQGLVGYVALTGQPLAISDVQHDQRFNQGFARSTGYVPRSILATPLLSGDRVIGVMEVLDKIEAPSFGMRDMELLGLFARQAAMAIHQSQVYDQLGKALVDGLCALVPPEDAELSVALKEMGEANHEDLLPAVAERFYAISQMGESEQRACLDILSTFQRYAHSKAEPIFR